MSSAERYQHAAEDALGEAGHNPVWSAEQWFRAAEVHALLAIEARLAQLVGDRPDRIPWEGDGAFAG
jgi:hypothetical protein